MSVQPEPQRPPLYDVPRSALSAHMDNRMVTDEITMVTYEDARRWRDEAVAAAERINSKVIADFQRQAAAAERARIRQAVEALGPLLDVGQYQGGYDCCGCSTLNQLFDDVMSIIDGGTE